MILKVENGNFAYSKGANVLNDINFEVKSGELLAILGPNGVGKTTLLRALMGMLKWKSGKSYIDGEDIKSMSPKKLWSKMAYVPQAKSASSAYSAFETVLLGRSSKIGVFNAPRKIDYEICEEIMESLDIAKLKDKKCSNMSGGEFQMVLIARALASEPELLILDEPESNLDFKNQLVVLDAMTNLVHKKNMACIFNTHYPAHALQRADKSLILTRGGVSYFGNTASLVNEDMIRKAFGVNAVIGEIETEGNVMQNVIPLDINTNDASSSFDSNKRAIAGITIISSTNEMYSKVNNILHDYNNLLVGRMGLPYKKFGLYIINITLDGTVGEINDLSQKLGVLPDVNVKTVFAKI